MKKTISIEVVEITAVFIIRKDYFNEEGLNAANVKDRIQQGIEIPIEECQVSIKK
jgi:hypothetical protein